MSTAIVFIVVLSGVLVVLGSLGFAFVSLPWIKHRLGIKSVGFTVSKQAPELDWRVERRGRRRYELDAWQNRFDELSVGHPVPMPTYDIAHTQNDRRYAEILRYGSVLSAAQREQVRRGMPL